MVPSLLGAVIFLTSGAGLLSPTSTMPRRLRKPRHAPTSSLSLPKAPCGSLSRPISLPPIRSPRQTPPKALPWGSPLPPSTILSQRNSHHRTASIRLEEADQKRLPTLTNSSFSLAGDNMRSRSRRCVQVLAPIIEEQPTPDRLSPMILPPSLNLAELHAEILLLSKPLSPTPLPSPRERRVIPVSKGRNFSRPFSAPVVSR
jgi:hypothetical protein